MRGRPKGSGRRSVAIPLTRIHTLHRTSAEGGDRGTVGYPPFRVCLCAMVGSLLLYSFQSGSGDAQQDPRGETSRRGRREREIGEGPPKSLYYKQPRTCCNHLETMAHRSVRLAKRSGPHNSRDASSTTLRAIVGPLRLHVCFFPPTDEFLPTATGPATSITRRVSHGETQTTETGYSGGMRVSNIPRHESCRAIFTRISKIKKNHILLVLHIYERTVLYSSHTNIYTADVIL